MKHLSEYIVENIDQNIDESLLSWFKSFFKKITASQKTTEQSGPVDVEDLKEITMNKEPVKLDSIDEKTIKDSWGHQKTGIPIIFDIVSHREKMMPDSTDPMVMEFFYKSGKLTYPASVILYDKKWILRENHLTVVALEPFKCMKNEDAVMKASLKAFENMAKTDKETKYEALIMKPLHKQMIGNVKKYGFKEDKEDEGVFIKKL